jgi:hypothetical protein
MNQVDLQILIISMRNMAWSFIEAEKYQVYSCRVYVGYACDVTVA